MSRDLVIITLMLLVALMYIVTIIFQPSLAKDVLEIVKYVVIAVISFYLGYAFREKNSYVSNPSVFKEKAIELNRIGYIAVGFGVALILQHVICFGVDLNLISHEWVGLYITIVGLILIGLTQKYLPRASKGVSNVVSTVLLIVVAVILVLVMYVILKSWVESTLTYWLNYFNNYVSQNLELNV